MSETMQLETIGTVRSPLTDPALAPRQGDEGAPDAWIVFLPAVISAISGLGVGHEVVILTWLHRAERDVLQVHPRDDASRPLRGVFSTRSADRPNPIGLHRVEVIAVEHDRLLVRNLEA